ncbi:hypothetical protein LAWI1_G006582 [Lachnellula willkommii]|uniref:Uncharacterized protein n=1 Tax=Lachnellula willkommii TaxID=215461 RepID=A0A559M912_9HELO|nr:hypothetical protein LAWI1_G006582 [Lachnellula willkommii]
MNEVLCSILCGEDEWCYDGEDKAMKFNSDGTGELWGRTSTQYWIVVDLQWKSISVKQPDTKANAAPIQSNNNGPRFIGQIELEITLLNRIPQAVQAYRPMPVFNELEDGAFQPRVYSIRIEKGNFMLPCFAGYDGLRLDTRYALRLLFDRSPYPPRKDWTKPEYGPDGCGFWDRKEFVGRITRGLDDKRAMNDPAAAGGWSSCVVC